MDRQNWFGNRKLVRYLDTIREHYLEQPELAIEDWKIVRMALIRLAMSKLNNLERQVTRRLNFDGLSERKVAEELGLTASRVHRIKWRAIRKLAGSIFLKLALSPLPSFFGTGGKPH